MVDTVKDLGVRTTAGKRTMWKMQQRVQEATRRSKKLNFLANMTNKRIWRLFKPAVFAAAS
eukprot:6865559-Pyramimonas_sp.AAC.1